MSEPRLDRADRRRSPAAMPGFRAGHAPGNKGLRYPADPPKVEEIVAVMRVAGDRAHGRRLASRRDLERRPDLRRSPRPHPKVMFGPAARNASRGASDRMLRGQKEPPGPGRCVAFVAIGTHVQYGDRLVRARGVRAGMSVRL